MFPVARNDWYTTALMFPVARNDWYTPALMFPEHF
jgi:hypothetical protein